MNLPKYPVTSDDSRLAYEFLSQGPAGTIKKIVSYTEIGDNIFNLAFGDWDETKQSFDDKALSNNADREKVLATIASTVIDFMRSHPGAKLFAQGQTLAKTRLYQMGINQNWDEINKSFVINGSYKGNWERFQQGRNYDAFLLEEK